MSTMAEINQISPFEHFVGLERSLLHPLGVEVAPLKGLGWRRGQGRDRLRLKVDFLLVLQRLQFSEQFLLKEFLKGLPEVVKEEWLKVLALLEHEV